METHLSSFGQDRTEEDGVLHSTSANVECMLSIWKQSCAMLLKKSDPPSNEMMSMLSMVSF